MKGYSLFVCVYLIGVGMDVPAPAPIILLPLLVKTLWYQELPVGWFYGQDANSTEARKREIEKLFIEDFGYCYNHAPDKLKPRLFLLASEKFGAIMNNIQKSD